MLNRVQPQREANLCFVASAAVCSWGGGHQKVGLLSTADSWTWNTGFCSDGSSQWSGLVPASYLSQWPVVMLGGKRSWSIPAFWQTSVQGLWARKSFLHLCLTAPGKLSYINTSNHALICFKFLLSWHPLRMSSVINCSVEKAPPFPLVFKQAAW